MTHGNIPCIIIKTTGDYMYWCTGHGRYMRRYHLDDHTDIMDTHTDASDTKKMHEVKATRGLAVFRHDHFWPAFGAYPHATDDRLFLAGN